MTDHAALLSEGRRRFKAGAFNEALACLLPILQSDAGNLDALYLVALTRLRQGFVGDGIALLERISAVRPDFIDALGHLASAYRAVNRPQDAADCYRRITALVPGSVEAAGTLASLLLEIDAVGEAVAVMERILERAPGRIDLRLMIARAKTLAGDRDGAGAQYRLGLAQAPDHPDLLAPLANLLSQGKRFAEAEPLYRRLTELAPEDAAAHYNLGVMLTELDRLEAAVPYFKTAIGLAPDMSAAHSNLGAALRALGDTEAALAAFAEAVRLDPENHIARWNEALALLALGRLDQGWAGHEARWHLPTYAHRRRDFAVPQWRGEDPAGKRILVHAEQGFGDTIQMARYLPLLAARGARVLLSVQPALTRLMATLPAAIELVPMGMEAEIDLHCPMMSLPLAFATRLETIPAEIPYLSAERAPAWQGARRRVGLVWAAAQYGDLSKTIELGLLEPLLQRAELDLVSLQREIPAADRVRYEAETRMEKPGERFADFAEAAAAIETLDLVISVDTSVAHLAGALGKPVWILLPFHADWRWLLGCCDSPWYPTARLFRQKRRGDWPGVIDAVGAALEAAP